jgi:neural Wiskott-Aldrich syndrome protein
VLPVPNGPAPAAPASVRVTVTAVTPAVAPDAKALPPAADAGAPPPAPAAKAPAGKGAGADLAKTHDGWLPPPSPTIVTEATKPARRPPAPSDTRAPPPVPPQQQGRPAPGNPVWADLSPDQAPAAASGGPPSRGDGAPRPAVPREFQPVAGGALAGPPPRQQAAMPGPVTGYMPSQWAPPSQPGLPPGTSQRPAQHNNTSPSPLNGAPNGHAPNHGANPAPAAASPAQRGATAPLTATIGKLTGAIPVKWRAGASQTVEVRLTPEELRALSQQLEGRGAAYAHDKIIAKALSVRLKAADHSFAIEPTSPETLWLDAQSLHLANDGAVWHWTAMPQSAGKKRLQLLISARSVGADGTVAETALPDQAVTAKVSRNGGRVVAKLFGYLAVALLGALIARYGESGIETLMAWKRGFQ